MKLSIVLLLLFIATTVRAQSGFGMPIDETAAFPLKWEFLREPLNGKNIVALGENLHGVKEYNMLKLELIRYLHENLGFNVLAVESDLALDYFGSVYRQQIPDTLLLKNLFMAPWHTEEYLQLTRYLKQHPELKIIGFDIESKRSVAEISSALGVAIDSSDQTFQAFFKQYAKWDEINGDKKRTSTGERDSVMAEVLQWVIGELYPGEKVIISAHNMHISNVPLQEACMGTLLRQQYGKRYYSAGFFHSLGDPMHVNRNFTYSNNATSLPENSLQSRFLASGAERLFVDLKSARKSKSSRWLDQEVDNVLLLRKYAYKINLSKSYDGVIWVKSVTHPNYVIANRYLEH